MAKAGAVPPPEECCWEEPCCDVPCDIASVQLTDAIATHNVIMDETAANGGMVQNVFRSAAASKFRDVDPIEAAATEAILNGVSRND